MDVKSAILVAKPDDHKSLYSDIEGLQQEDLPAFFFHQIFELSDVLYQSARAIFSAKVEYWNTIRAAFRLIVFNSWEDILERINSPPE